jgi:HAD superfamily phosphoserine phosphatase-like hydrolase
MIEPVKRYLFVSDFDQTLSFNDSGQVLAEMIGIPPQEFERKARGMAQLNLVQQGGELAYLLLHDPEFRSRVRKNMLYEVGKRVRLKPGIDLLYKALREEIPGYEFEFYVISAGPVQVIRAALEGIVPSDHIFGTEFKYSEAGEIERIESVTAGYGKVAKLDKLQYDLLISPDRIVYVGDGSSDVHVMLHVNRRDGFTIAVSENKFLAPIAKRSILADDALPVIIPILEEIVGWNVQQIRAFFAERGYQIQEWEKVHTDKLTLRPLASAVRESAAGI